MFQKLRLLHSKNKWITLLINFIGGTETLAIVIYNLVLSKLLQRNVQHKYTWDELRTLEQIYQTHYIIW